MEELPNGDLYRGALSKNRVNKKLSEQYYQGCILAVMYNPFFLEYAGRGSHDFVSILNTLNGTCGTGLLSTATFTCLHSVLQDSKGLLSQEMPSTSTIATNTKCTKTGQQH